MAFLRCEGTRQWDSDDDDDNDDDNDDDDDDNDGNDDDSVGALWGTSSSGDNLYSNSHRGCIAQDTLLSTFLARQYVHPRGFARASVCVQIRQAVIQVSLADDNYQARQSPILSDSVTHVANSFCRVYDRAFSGSLKSQVRYRTAILKKKISETLRGSPSHATVIQLTAVQNKVSSYLTTNRPTRNRPTKGKVPKVDESETSSTQTSFKW